MTDQPSSPTATASVDDRAAELLRELAGPRASFREHQLEAIRDLAADRARVLCVQRTGWGKSAVYFVATALLREQGAGPTLIVSPLLALMRNQVAAAERLGLRAHTVNSTNRDAWSEIQRHLEADDVDLLLISPERLNHPGFRSEMLPVFAERVGLLVIDEAHCISDWGHDFRPDYRRIRDMLERLPERVAVLCTTATANDRVVADVTDQLALGHDRAALRSYRGGLMRDSLRLEVVELPDKAQRLAWLATHLPELPGSGIIYTLTKGDAETVASWLAEQGIAAAAYSGETDPAVREDIERKLLANELKAVVATSALGMGYDKPDLGFVVHYQAPGSVIAYYQQVGRAGRAIDGAQVVLLRGAEDRRIQDYFITQAFPPRERVEQVLAAIAEGGDSGAGLNELLAQVRLGRNRLLAMLKVLDVEGAVEKKGSRYVMGGEQWEYDGDRYDQVTALRRREQQAMANFGADGRCLMRALAEELDDPAPEDCGRCAVCTQAKWADELDPALARAAQLHLRSQPLDIEVKKMAPDANGSMRRIPEGVLPELGRALGRLGDSGWDTLVEEGARTGRYPDELVEGAIELIRRWKPPISWVTVVPSARKPDLLNDLGARIAAGLELPFAPVVERVAERARQREMENTPAQVANVRGAFAVAATVPDGRCLLIDDVRFSGWTLAMVAGQIRQRGCAAVYPFALSTAY
ncbi:MAG: ATP-dependent DNA helicase RecQ [Solirubrobacteraceae bacterium]|nr:ATP-dependent DNA helicase RecQ [Solirubrobacteraceae bacterium]